MKKPLLDKLTAAGVSAELLAEVLAAHGQSVQAEKDKLEPLNTQLTTANTTIQGMKSTVEQFKGVDLVALNKKIADGETKYDTDIANIRRENALANILTAHKVKNNKALMALLDHESIKLDGDKLVGIDEQLKMLQESDSYLFDLAQNLPVANPAFNLNSGFEHNNSLTLTKEDFNRMGYEKRAEVFNSSPELYKQLTNKGD